MTPQNRRKKNPRKKPSFNLKEILLYGIPLWLGSPIAGFYFAGWLGFKSAIAGLIVLGAYIASEVLVREKSRKLPDSQAIALIVASSGARLIALLIVSYLLYQFSNLNLLILLLTVAFGFTAVLFISIKNFMN